MMTRRNWFPLAGAVLTGAAFPGFLTAAENPVAAQLEKIRQKHKLPALGGALFAADGTVTTAAVCGVRKKGRPESATVEDRWHYGSMTKAMTAVLVGQLVDEKKLKWTDTVGDLLPQDCKGCAPGVKRITVSQLLRHRSGLVANVEWWQIPAGKRSLLLRAAAPASGPDIQPGAAFLYSNTGYAVLGRILEARRGQTWEKIIEDRLFRPLKMEAGIGPVSGEGKPDQPWPHGKDGQPLPDNGLPSDNAPSLGPAGRVHAPLAGYAKFAAAVLRGGAGKSAAGLHPDTWKALLTPDADSGYAGGLGVLDRPWGGGAPVFSHNGSNTANYSVVWLAPARGFGVVAVTNQAGGDAEAACDAVCTALIAVHG